MDFHSLTRKELQTLCKKNKIPANITNIAMADALSDLQYVSFLFLDLLFSCVIFLGINDQIWSNLLGGNYEGHNVEIENVYGS